MSYNEIKVHSFFADFDWYGLASEATLRDSVTLIEQAKAAMKGDKKKDTNVLKFKKVSDLRSSTCPKSDT